MTLSTTPCLRIVLFTNDKSVTALARGQAVLSKLIELGHQVTVIGDRDLDGDFIAEMQYLAPDLFIVAGYSRIFRKPLLDVPKHGTWNCHAGPVPEYRGGSPLNWQIIDGCEDLGVSLIQMDEGIDTGPVINRRYTMKFDRDIAEAHKWANQTFPLMIEAALDRLQNSDFLTFPQEQTDLKPCKQRNDDMGEIDLTSSREQIVNLVRALRRPYQGAWIPLKNGERLRVWEVS